MKSLFEYSSYRAYLSDFIQEQKKTTPPLTLAKLAKKLTMSASALQMTLTGKRNLTVAKIHEIAAVLDLDENEHEFFESLVLREQAAGRREKKYYERRLERARAANGLEVHRVHQRELLSDWFVPSVLVYLTDLQGTPDLERLSHELGLAKERVTELVARLERTGYIKRTGQHLHIVYDRLASNFPKEQFLIKMAEEAGARIRRDFKTPGNYFEAHTMTLTPEGYDEFVAGYKTLLQATIQAGPERSDDARIYQAFQAFFPTV